MTSHALVRREERTFVRLVRRKGRNKFGAEFGGGTLYSAVRRLDSLYSQHPRKVSSSAPFSMVSIRGPEPGLEFSGVEKPRRREPEDGKKF